MSLPSASPSGGRGRAIVAGVVIGVVVFALGLGGVLAVLVSRSNSGSAGSSTQASPTLPVVTPSAESGPMPRTDPRLARFYQQKLAWRGCTGGQCTTLTVPLDYTHPNGATIKVAVLRVPAADPAHRVGDLVINPGGPGGSGVQYAQAATTVFGKALIDHFDIVGFDPRGVGRSDPLTCLGTAGLDRLLAFDPSPDTTAERTEMDRLVHGFGEACLRHSGGIARHMSTEEVARDMDILRAALKQPRLDYLGASYGTLLGATYANLFPHHVGRMVLDGALDPKLSNLQLSLAQAHGFQVALDAYVAHCVQGGSCPLGSTVDVAIRRVGTLLDQIEAHPLPTGSKRPLTGGLAMMGVWMPLYLKSWWDQLTLGFKQAIDDHNGSVLLSMADLYTGRGSTGYLDNSMNALYDVNCLDNDESIPTSQVPAYFPQFEKASPTFGRAFAYSLSTCSMWPVRSGKHTVAMHAAGAPPIVVLGTTRDPATPLAWARGLASELDSGVLVTRNGDGHTAYHEGNSCIDHAVESYLVADQVPRKGLAC